MATTNIYTGDTIIHNDATTICTCDTITHNDATTICTGKPTTHTTEPTTHTPCGRHAHLGRSQKKSGEDNHYPPRLAVFQSITGMTGN